jgi:hypothetical protein
MNDKFGCCGFYEKCSELNKCVRPEIIDRCEYWSLNLSKGRNFYKKGFKITEAKAQESYGWKYKQLKFI